MEHTNENEKMYALLCKVVFGEATEAESKEVEAALEASAELREQKAELLATVSLVRGAFGDATGGDELSVSARGALASAAEDAARGAETPILRGGPWYRSTAFRAAAAVTLLGGAGYAAVLALDPSGEVAPDDSTETGLASAEPLDEFGNIRFAREDEELKSRSETLGFTTDQPSVAADELLEEAAATLEALTKMTDGLGVTPVAGNVANAPAGAEQSKNETVFLLQADPAVTSLHSLGYAGGRFAESANGVPIQAELGDLYGEAIKKGWAGEVNFGITPTPLSLGEADAGEKTAGYAFVGAVESSPVTTGGVGGGGGVTRGVSPNPVPVDLPSSGASTATRNSVAGPSTPAPASPAGPATPGLSVAESKQPAIGTASDDFFLGRGAADKRRGMSGEFERSRHRRSFDRIQPTRLPNERPHDMFFRFYGDNPFVVSKQDALSTFAADVDTASFALARRTLESGFLPQREQIRTEEFVNFARPDLAPPTEGTFATYAELAPSPFGGREDRWLLRVGVRAKEIQREERPPLALTFVVDTSGSMKENNRLELVKHALRLLVDQLDARDTIAIVAFSNEARSVLGPTPATASDTIETALFQLQPDGSTNAEAGLKLGYGTAEATLLDGVQSRVVFLSDGVANVGQTDQDRIADDVQRQTERGIFLNTIGVGLGNHNDVFLEQLADKGEGVCDYVGDAKDARRAIVERFVGGFLTVAKDVKIQVEFAPEHVLRWRQLGYENRAVRDADFRNDAVDAGEIGAGHQVTCLYEVELASSDIAAADTLATVRLRWKPVTPGEAQPAGEVAETSHTVRYEEVVAPSFRGSSEGFRRSALSAQLAECLRRSVHVRGDSVEVLGKELAQLLADAPSEDTATVAAMTRSAIQLGLKSLPGPKPTDMDVEHRKAYYRALIRDLGGADPSGDASGEAGEHGAGTPPSGVMFDTYETHIRDILNGDSKGKPH